MVHVHPFVLTTIEVQGTPQNGTPPKDKYGEGSTYVGFAGWIEEDPNDRDVAYLMDVKLWKDNWFSAVKVTEETFFKAVAAKGKKVLACIHGYRVEPEHWLDSCRKIENTKVKTGEAFGKNHTVIPVIWPGGNRNYLTEKPIAKQAGKALDSIEKLDGLNKVSLMCHSMGNRVLMSYAYEQNYKTYPKRFENVFMVAPDIWEECFNDRVHQFQTKWEFGNAGWKLCQMVRGKIYICCYSEDKALWYSKGVNKGAERLGRYGSWQQTHTYKRCTVLKSKLEDFNMKLEDHKYREDELIAADSEYLHSYQTAPSVVQLYYDKMNN